MKKILVSEAWLNEVANSESTRRCYGQNIDRFLEFVNCTLEEIEKEWDSVATYRQEKMFKKRWTRKVKQYKAILNCDKNLAQGSVETYMTPIASFFQYLETPIRVPMNQISVTYHNRDILREELDSIIKNTPHIRDKAFFCMVAQTGLRPIVLSRLQYRDVKEDWERKVVPCRIHIPKKKNKGGYKEHYTFMPQESIDYLRKYFDSRFRMENNPEDEDLLFSQSNKEDKPLDITSESGIFSRVVIKLGICKQEKKGKPKPVRLYNLRKFFRNNIVDSSEIDSVDCHFFMGHKLNMNDEHYFSAQNIDKFRKKFDEASEYIKISGVPDTYREKMRYLETKVAQTEKDMERRIQEQVENAVNKLFKRHVVIPEVENEYYKMVEKYVETSTGVKPKSVLYRVIETSTGQKIIICLGYWHNGEFASLNQERITLG